MVGLIFNLFFFKWSSFNSKYILSTEQTELTQPNKPNKLIQLAYSVDRMYLELNEDRGGQPGNAQHPQCWLGQWILTVLEGLSIPNNFNFLAKLYALIILQN